MQKQYLQVLIFVRFLRTVLNNGNIYKLAKVLTCDVTQRPNAGK